jgi:hypothetical protein
LLTTSQLKIFDPTNGTSLTWKVDIAAGTSMFVFAFAHVAQILIAITYSALWKSRIPLGQ